MSAINTPTLNYNTKAGFSNTAALSALGVWGTTTAPTNQGVLDPPTLDKTAFGRGVATTNAEKYTFTTTLPAAPTFVYIRADDTETSSLRLINPTTTSVEGGVAVVSGRIKVSNAYGSELLPLSLMATAQYYTGTGWLNSGFDSVTQLALTYAGTLVPTPTRTLSPSTLIVSGATLTIKLAAPGSGKTGTVIVHPAVDPSSPGSPVMTLIDGTATFGVYKNSNGFIYRRESY
jgi:MSHA biogenesis protein MshQ